MFHNAITRGKFDQKSGRWIIEAVPYAECEEYAEPIDYAKRAREAYEARLRGEEIPMDPETKAKNEAGFDSVLRYLEEKVRRIREGCGQKEAGDGVG